MRFCDPIVLPGRGDTPESCLANARAFARTPGRRYVERRGVPLAVAESAGVLFDPDFAGRPTVLVALRDQKDAISSVHGRFLDVRRGQNKMLTVGTGNGTISVLGGWRVDPFILVEGLFDALSLAACGAG